MNAKAKYIVDTLEELYPVVEPPLHHSDAYTLLIAVLLSAQCKDERVNQITPLLFAKASSPEDMVKMSIDQIRDIIKPCGLSPAKSKAIHRLSEILLEKHEAKVPDSFQDLEALPGVGHKTASVVMAQIFGLPTFPVDTHIHRLATRWELTSGKSVAQTEADCKKSFPKKYWNKLHLQIIFYGRQYCPARGHKLELCPICLHFETKKQKIILRKN